MLPVTGASHGAFMLRRQARLSVSHDRRHHLKLHVNGMSFWPIPCEVPKTSSTWLLRVAVSFCSLCFICSIERKKQRKMDVGEGLDHMVRFKYVATSRDCVALPYVDIPMDEVVVCPPVRNNSDARGQSIYVGANADPCDGTTHARSSSSSKLMACVSVVRHRRCCGRADAGRATLEPSSIHAMALLEERNSCRIGCHY
jgi:hypothetical protein